MDIKDYNDMLQKYVSLARSVSKDSSTYRQAVSSLRNLEKNYGTTIPVEHQPIDTEQHRKNFLKYNPDAASDAGFIKMGSAVIAFTIGIAIGGLLCGSLISIGLGLIAALPNGVMVLRKKIILSRNVKHWLADHPISDHEIWHVADYWE